LKNIEINSLLPNNFEEYEENMGRLAFSICIDILRQLDIMQKAGDKETLDSLIKKAGIHEQGVYLIERILFILCEDGEFAEEDKVYKRVKKTDIEGPPEFFVILTEAYPEEAASLRWLARAYGSMYGFLKGRVYGEDILFPWGDFDLVEKVYDSGNIYKFYPALAARFIKALIEENNLNDIRIFEAGAGTGNSTKHVLNQIKNGIAEYFYTDISRSLLKQAKKTFSEFNFFNFKMFDLTKPPEDQDIPADYYDIVLGVSVLHALPDVISAVNYLYKLIKPGGYLILSEISPPENSIYRFMELTFGLIPSYSDYSDKKLRPLSPLMRLSSWQQVFDNAGLKSTGYLPEKAEKGFDRGGIVFGQK
jgi:SAM-dependent methyltransferase